MTELQEEINEAIHQAQTAVSTVLRTSTSETLRQYEDHIKSIENEYEPHLETFNRLSPGSCKDTAETILNSVITLTGFEASNCAKIYDTNVAEKVANANSALVGFDAAYSELQSIVIKAFIGKNMFVNPEEIEQRFSVIFNLIQEVWSDSKPEFDDLRRNLAVGVAEQNMILGLCHDSILQVAIGQFGWFRSIASTCNDFNLPQSASDRIGKSAEPWEQLSKDFFEQFAKLESFEWKK